MCKCKAKHIRADSTHSVIYLTTAIALASAKIKPIEAPNSEIKKDICLVSD